MGTQELDRIELRPITLTDARFLFRLLKERMPEANISHKAMPSFLGHCRFILSKPYAVWYVIRDGKRKLGSIYLTRENEIGIFVLDAWRGKGIGRQALGELMRLNPRERYLANISPRNTGSQEFFARHKFRPIQFTYALEMEKA